jgi:hypothetical protein
MMLLYFSFLNQVWVAGMHVWHGLRRNVFFFSFLFLFFVFFLFLGGERLYRTRPCRDKTRQTNVTRRGKTPAGHKAT